MKATPSEQAAIDSLYRITSVLSQTEDPKEALKLILREIVDVLKPNSAAIYLLNRDSQLLEIVASHELPEDCKEISINIHQGITGWVALHGKARVIPEVKKEPRYISLKENINSEMAVPMKDRGSVIGVVVVDSDIKDAFDSSALKILSLMSLEASRVVSRLWLVQQLRKKADQLESLLGMTQTITRQKDPNSIYEKLAQEGLSILNCHSCAIFLLNPNKDMLHMQTFYDQNGPLETAEAVLISESTLGSVIRRGKQAEVQRLLYTDESSLLKVVQEKGIVSMLAAPLIIGDEVVGVIAAFTNTLRRFKNDEKDAFEALSAIGGIAAQNAQLYARIFETEDSLRSNEKLTTLGMLAAEIAHEIRNPLTVIKLLFDSLNLDFHELDDRHQDVALIKEKLGQLEEIVERVLGFGRTREGMNASYDFNQIVEETILLMRLKLEQRTIRLEYYPNERPIRVEVNKGQIQQVILNLILNAESVLSNGGNIKIETYEADGRANFRISDNGPGMPEEAKNRIFESFLTQRAEGTGLGLSISKRILRSHMGDIALDVSTEEGTTFSFYLPIQ